MDNTILIISLVFLICISAFFSSSETAMMSLNRYRLRYLVKKNNKKAIRAQKLLSKPDKLLGVILIGNTFANILASALLTILADNLFGAIGVAIATILLTIIILLFAEIIPKTISALKSEMVAFPFSLPLTILLWIGYPIVWVMNFIANNIMLVFGLNVYKHKSDASLSKEELHSVVNDSGKSLTKKHRNMLLGVLELDTIKVSDIMTPRQNIKGIDLEKDNWKENLIKSKHSIVPIFYDNIDELSGCIDINDFFKFLIKNNLKVEDVSKEDVLKLVFEPYCIPGNINSQKQLVFFQESGKRLALVVDEYGSIDGLITVEDILEEIVGEFSDSYDIKKWVKESKNNGFIVDARITIREFNRHTNFNLSYTGANTISGMIIDYLTTIPDGKCCLKIENYLIEILSVDDKYIKKIEIKEYI